ncbi:MAG: radical SAM protein [Clostridia bacterium]|nr:radical SAM protein [Clostridia bacterium]
MEFVKAKTILTKVKDGSEWYGVDYNMNLYRGCSHGCIYCDSRSDCYHIENFDIVKGKENMLHILESELSKKRLKGVVGIGAMSDTYNPMEIKYQQTRGALQLISKYSFGVSIDTKSDLILRDIDLLKEINSKNNVIVKFTITTPDDNLSKIIEPNVCVSSKRLEAIKKLNDNGIFAGIMMNPVLPFITDKEDDIKKLVKLANEYDAKFIHTYMGMTLRENQRVYYFDKLDEKFPGLKEKYIKTYGDRYNCLVPNYKQLYKVFADECDKYGILYKMNDIIRAYKKKSTNDEQISLF